MHIRQLSLSEEVQRLEKEKLVLKKVKKKLQNQQKQLDEATVALAQYQAEAAPEKSMASALEIQLQVKDLEMSELRASVSSLKDENTSLRNLTEQQRQRIETLNVRLAELVSELHSTRERFVDTSIHRFTSSRHRSSSSDSSPTDDIVKDAKRRIKHLEEEFEAIGRYHKNFQAKHLNDSIMSSVHGSSSGQLFLPLPRTPTSTAHHNISLPNLEHNASLSPQFGTPRQSYHLAQTHPPSIPKFTKTYSPRQRNVEMPKHVTINNSQYVSNTQDKIVPTSVNNVASNDSNSTVSESAKDLNNSSLESSKKVDPLVDQTSDLVKALTLSRGMELSSNAQLVSSNGLEIIDDPNNSRDKIDASNVQQTASKGTYMVEQVQNTPFFGEMNLTSNLQLIPSNDYHVIESIGPMGDAQPVQATPLLNVSNIKIVKTNGDAIGNAQTIVPSIQVNPTSNIVNGNSLVKENTELSLPKQKVTLIPNVSKEMNEESQKSTSSSSKHISVGAPSSKDDADDFWNL
ncbi:hypothetical protein B566_EDAN003946 [Ephemera danica]|nr:hypothetical protein B566_EDAN003946 [Ephemera danica]